MTDCPVKKEKNPVQTRNSEKPELFVDKTANNPFFEFRHFYGAVTYENGKTRVQAAENRFVDGRLETERFEGVAGGDIYVNFVEQMCDFYMGLMSSFMKPLSFFNPFLPAAPKERRTK